MVCKKIKRILSLGMAAALCLACLALPAFALENDVSATPESAAIEGGNSEEPTCCPSELLLSLARKLQSHIKVLVFLP